MRSFESPVSLEDNGFIRLCQSCLRCAYIVEARTSTPDAHEPDFKPYFCQRHDQEFSGTEVEQYTCDYFC